MLCSHYGVYSSALEGGRTTGRCAPDFDFINEVKKKDTLCPVTTIRDRSMKVTFLSFYILSGMLDVKEYNKQDRYPFGSPNNHFYIHVNRNGTVRDDLSTLKLATELEQDWTMERAIDVIVGYDGTPFDLFKNVLGASVTILFE